MRPETSDYLAKSQTLLSEAESIFGIHLHEAAGRAAYLGAFHAAQAFLFEKTGRAPKIHRGVHKEFLRLTKDEPRIAADLRTFLSESYNVKFIADYAVGPRARLSAEEASATIETAKRFEAQIGALLG